MTDQLQEGLVISYFGQTVAVLNDGGDVFACHLRRNQQLPVVGDRVTFALDNEQKGTIKNVAPRHTVLQRGTGHGDMKPIAANIDKIFVIMAPPPIFSCALVDRYLIAAELSQIKASIVINKGDLLAHDDKEKATELLSIYQKIGYPAFITSVFEKKGLQDLEAALSNQRGVLIGPSGVGKSSIIAALGIDEEIRIGEVSQKGTGKHTTTASRLYHLRNGGELIDSPGVREFNLWKVSLGELQAGFPEFKVKEACRFRDCRHLKEPGCAIKNAVENGIISASRYKSYEDLASLITKN